MGPLNGNSSTTCSARRRLRLNRNKTNPVNNYANETNVNICPHQNNHQKGSKGDGEELQQVDGWMDRWHVFNMFYGRGGGIGINPHN